LIPPFTVIKTEQQQRQRHQVRDLRDLETEERLRNVLASDRVVDDALRNLEIDVDQRKADRRHDQQQDLVAPGVMDDVSKKGAFHRVRTPAGLIVTRFPHGGRNGNGRADRGVGPMLTSADPTA
jgi:hypothetical protein